MDTPTYEKVSFIGLGKMGLPIARNLLKAGFPLTVYNRTRSKMSSIVDQGACPSGSPFDAAQNADVVFTCLMDDQSVLDVVTGENGILAGMKPGSIHINTATVSPNLAVKMAALHSEHGVRYLAAPLFGRPNAAEAGTLLTYIAGDQLAVESCENLFAAYTKNHIYLGPDHKVANSVKLIVNFMLVASIELFSEVYALAEKSNIPSDVTRGLIPTVLSHPALEDYNRRIESRDFQSAFNMTTGFKDVSLMLEASTSLQSPLPIANIVRDRMITAFAYGMTDLDWTAISEVVRKNSGILPF